MNYLHKLANKIGLYLLDFKTNIILKKEHQLKLKTQNKADEELINKVTKHNHEKVILRKTLKRYYEKYGR